MTTAVVLVFRCSDVAVSPVGGVRTLFVPGVLSSRRSSAIQDLPYRQPGGCCHLPGVAELGLARDHLAIEPSTFYRNAHAGHLHGDEVARQSDPDLDLGTHAATGSIRADLPGVLQDAEGADLSLAEQRMALAIRMAHREVQQEAQGRLREMGSTLAALHVHDGKVLIAHVGDSRVYRIRNGHIEQMTRDHSLTADLEAAGCENMLAHLPPHYRHMVTRCIAANANAQPDFRVMDSLPGDTYVLCSDGVHDVLGRDAILDAVHDAGCDEASERVVARAFAEGTQDNITVVVVRF